MKTYSKIATVLTAAAVMALEAGPALAQQVTDSVQNLPGPGALGLVAGGIAAAIIVARRSR